MGYQIICIYFNYSSGKQIGLIKFTRLRASIFFFQMLRREEGGLILPLTCAPAGVGSTTTESLSLSNFYLIAVMWHIRKYLIDLEKPMDNTLDL